MPVDIIIHCEECGTDFAWTAWEQASGERPRLCPGCRFVAPSGGRQRGLVKWFSRGKGYGFITPPDGPELFVHRASLVPGQPLPRAGQLVEFSLRATSRGVQAEDVAILEAAGEEDSQREE